MNYKLEDLSPEEAKDLTEEITKVLEKYNAEIGVSSQINIMKRVEESPANPDGLVPSPFLTSNGENPETKSDSETA